MEPGRILVEMQEGAAFAIEDAGAALDQALLPADIGEQSAEGQYFRRYYQLALQRTENPVFALTWTIFHPIDESSPLYGASPHALAAADALQALM